MEAVNDLIDNPSPRCACMLVVDTSSSMSGEPIEELNRGIQQFMEEVRSDEFAASSVELGIVAFGGSVRVVQEFGPLDKAAPPRLEASGDTPMGRAVEEAVRRLESRKREFRDAGVSYYQPWLVLMTDGQPTDSWQRAAEQLRQLAESRKLIVFGIGIGSSCDLQTLGAFCPTSRPPKRLEGLKFRELFQWLSQSMARVSVSTPGAEVALPSTDDWSSISV